MKSQLSVILILIACILTGCGKSMKDVAGVYETEEIKESIKGTGTAYYSTTWVLDLAERGTYTLKEMKFRKHVKGQTFDPLPLEGMSTGGAWRFQDGEATVTVKRPRNDGSVGMIAVDLPFSVEASGDLISDLPPFPSGDPVNRPQAMWDLMDELTGVGSCLRFKRVE
jgi:hypothetical protein